MNDLRIGVLGAARISKDALFVPAGDTDGVVVAAIAARSRSRAARQAKKFKIATVHKSYDALLHDPDIDAIYNPLPTSLHHPWTIAALAAGKHVLCEKPFASNAALAQQMVDAGARAYERDGLILMEAFHWRYHPFAYRLAQIIESGVIGTMNRFDAEFSVPINPSDDVRHAYELSGGALMDLGCYPVQWVRFASGEEPRVVEASMQQGRPNVDVKTVIELAFPGGATGTIRTAMTEDAERTNWLKVIGTDGEIDAQNPLAPHHGNKITVSVNGEQTIEQVEGKSSYHYQLEAFRDAIRLGTSFPTGGADSVATMTVIDAAYVAAGLTPRGTQLPADGRLS